MNECGRHSATKSAAGASESWKECLGAGRVDEAGGWLDRCERARPDDAAVWGARLEWAKAAGRPEDFAALDAMFGADPDGISAVEEFARAAGLEVVAANARGALVTLRGTMRTFAAAFEIDLALYRRGTATFTSYTKAVSIPAALGPYVDWVFGLETAPVVGDTGRPVAPPVPPNTDCPQDAPIPEPRDGMAAQSPIR